MGHQVCMLTTVCLQIAEMTGAKIDELTELIEKNK